MLDNAQLTEVFADTIVQHLNSHGINLFTIAPGSRSTPLVRAVCKLNNTSKIVHFDERGCGFFSLGASKANKNPSCVIVTSGSAPGHLLPSIMEAKNTEIPLIILTADRPKELHHCGSNQTIKQSQMFQNYVKWHVDLTEASELSESDYIRSIIAKAHLEATTHPKGPVHINIPFREPFISKESSKSPLCAYLKTIQSKPRISPEDLKEIADKLTKHQKGIIIAGYESFSNQEDVSTIDELSKKLNFPIFADVVSSLRGKKLENSIDHYTYLCSLKQVQENLKPTCILHFGKQYVSKPLLYWLKDITLELMVNVQNSTEIQDPFHHTTHKVVSDPLDFCRELLPKLSQAQNPTYLNSWKELSSASKSVFHEIAEMELSESFLFHKLNGMKFKNNTNLYLSSSMPIRNADAYFFPNDFIQTYSSRGVSGIDGNIATALGITFSTNRRSIVVLGDQTTLHDLNSLALTKQVKKPVIFFVINNGGGSIFSMLPIARHQDCFDKYFRAQHNYEFSSLAKMFDLDYRSITTKAALESVLENIETVTTHTLFEIKTPANQNIRLHKNALTALEELHALCS